MAKVCKTCGIAIPDHDELESCPKCCSHPELHFYPDSQTKNLVMLCRCCWEDMMEYPVTLHEDYVAIKKTQQAIPTTQNLVARFFKLRRSERRKIAEQLGLTIGPRYQDPTTSDLDRYREVLQLAKDRDLLHEVARRVAMFEQQETRHD
jgi:hypothetical protein